MNPEITWIDSTKSFDRDFIHHISSKNPETYSNYHCDVLIYLFHKILNVSPGNRGQHSISDLHSLFADTPFLNGSIFASHSNNKVIRLADSDYWSEDGSHDGLFDILSEFQWTLDEHSAQTNDQALDPELLGALFERLVSLADHSRPPPRRKPKGTYYTPRDVVSVMVVDALVARLLREEDLTLNENELRLLFSEADHRVPEWPAFTCRQVAERLQRLTIFDPAVGSGVFLLGILEALMVAFAKLNPTDDFRANRGQLVRSVIQNQLHGGDIQPLAAQIAKLRLFLAIEAAEGVKTGPLPNLESRIVNADALGTVPDAGWRPGIAEHLSEADPDFQRLLGEIVANRREWFDAHDPHTKKQLLDRDSQLRTDFLRIVDRVPVTTQYRSFAAWSPLKHDDSIADSDPRLIFSRTPWQGFDIVIANPPYGDLPKQMAKRAADRGYRSANARRSEAPFIELAMTLANPERGVVELVLPLGVSFRLDHAELRTLVEAQSTRLNLRHYDMTPGKIFNTVPTAKDWPNKQRAVLFTAWRGTGCRVQTTGLRRWFEMPRRQERAFCLANLRTVPALNIPYASTDRRISSQWLRTPTVATQALVSALLRQSRSVGDLTSTHSEADLLMGLPRTAYQYVTALPAGVASPRRESLLRFRNREDFLLALAALNGHAFYGWWLMTDDGFDVNSHTVMAFRIPDRWLREGEDRDQALALAERLIAAIPDCQTGKRNAGTQWQNVDFFSGARDVIEEIDRLQIQSVDLPFEPLISDLRTMRSSSSWSLS